MKYDPSDINTRFDALIVMLGAVLLITVIVIYNL